jgi:histidinol dehydrogenase
LQNSVALVVQQAEICSIINTYAPEHLILQTLFNDELIEGIINAGSVFIGNYTPESAGDYASGTNHTLPTNGYARQYSGVSLDSFVKKITYQKISEEGLKNIGSAIECMAESEELLAHKNAVSIRLKNATK